MRPPDRGAYCLLIHLQADREATVGRLGRFRFPKGYYVYCGSAMRGLAARIARHQRRVKKLRWHIDCLLALPAARFVACVPYPSHRREECAINQQVQRLPGAGIPVHGFGSSDCTRGCPAHLTYFERCPGLPGPIPQSATAIEARNPS
ncbi:MAG TPA: GIY-YIG nuclease family protein [Planctomycetota bacterium]|nr:GIY-YIG nuclease family protein [Planctomycetota bacterium]